MVKVGNQGLDDRYIRLRSHRISHPVVSGLRQSHSITFSRPGCTAEVHCREMEAICTIIP